MCNTPAVDYSDYPLYPIEPLCYSRGCINPQEKNELYCTNHMGGDGIYVADCDCAGCVLFNAQQGKEAAPYGRCREEARSEKQLVFDLDTGGHSMCMIPLKEDGTCPNAHNHHSEWIRLYAK